MTNESFESKYQRLERLTELAEVLSQQTDFEEILRLVTEEAACLLKAEIVLIMMLNPRTHQTMRTIFRGGKRGHEKRYHTLHLQVCGWVIKNNRSFLSLNIREDDRFRKNRFKDLPVKSVLCVPLRTEGIIIGSILLLNKLCGAEFDVQDVRSLEKLAALTAPSLRNTQKIQEYFTALLPEAALLTKYQELGLLGKSKRFVELLQAIEAAARCDVRVLLEGQSGTGKELIARAIHKLSLRCDAPFVALDCGAIPANLLESELFGHVKGAFTGATQDRKGLLEEASGGTLFMDEIANLPLDMQAKFMRVLQEGEVRPLGSNKSRRVDVRIISASSGALHKWVESEKFREDLFYRLHVYPIHVPSLNERRDDIPLLADHFLGKFAQQQQKQVEIFHEAIINFMKVRTWTGNIRELENFVERLVTVAPGDSQILRPEHLPDDIKKELKKAKRIYEDDSVTRPLSENLAEFETQLIRKALIENDWNQSKTARALKISEPNLRYRMNKLGITRPA